VDGDPDGAVIYPYCFRFPESKRGRHPFKSLYTSDWEQLALDLSAEELASAAMDGFGLSAEEEMEWRMLRHSTFYVGDPVLSRIGFIRRI
jgi:hypothetical protein